MQFKIKATFFFIIGANCSVLVGVSGIGNIDCKAIIDSSQNVKHHFSNSFETRFNLMYTYPISKLETRGFVCTACSIFKSDCSDMAIQRAYLICHCHEYYNGNGHIQVSMSTIGEISQFTFIQDLPSIYISLLYREFENITKNLDIVNYVICNRCISTWMVTFVPIDNREMYR